jgi:hypothetical protein
MSENLYSITHVNLWRMNSVFDCRHQRTLNTLNHPHWVQYPFTIVNVGRNCRSPLCSFRMSRLPSGERGKLKSTINLMASHLSTVHNVETILYSWDMRISQPWLWRVLYSSLIEARLSWETRVNVYQSQSQSQNPVTTDGQSVSRSVSLGIEPLLGVMTGS